MHQQQIFHSLKPNTKKKTKNQKYQLQIYITLSSICWNISLLNPINYNLLLTLHSTRTTDSHSHWKQTKYSFSSSNTRTHSALHTDLVND